MQYVLEDLRNQPEKEIELLDLEALIVLHVVQDAQENILDLLGLDKRGNMLRIIEVIMEYIVLGLAWLLSL